MSEKETRGKVQTASITPHRFADVLFVCVGVRIDKAQQCVFVRILVGIYSIPTDIRLRQCERVYHQSACTFPPGDHR